MFQLYHSINLFFLGYLFSPRCSYFLWRITHILLCSEPIKTNLNWIQSDATIGNTWTDWCLPYKIQAVFLHCNYQTCLLRSWKNAFMILKLIHTLKQKTLLDVIHATGFPTLKGILWFFYAQKWIIYLWSTFWWIRCFPFCLTINNFDDWRVNWCHILGSPLDRLSNSGWFIIHQSGKIWHVILLWVCGMTAIADSASCSPVDFK